MTSDSELLRLYSKAGSEPAFAELVDRYLGLVYSSALRQLAGDAHRAKDVSQMVFADLARKAGRLTGHSALSAWLYQSTRYAVAGVVRTEIRRKNREKEADAMREMNESPDPAAGWDRLGPVIDEVIVTLSQKEREVVCLRFFSGRTFGEIGARYKITADAARFRVDRALEKMRENLARRGVNSTAVALAVALETQVCSAAPAGMAATIAGTAAMGAAAPTGVFLFQLMATYKQIAIGAALVVAAASVPTIEIVRQHALEREIASLAEQTAPLPELRAQNLHLLAERNALSAARGTSVNGRIAAGGNASAASLSTGASKAPIGGMQIPKGVVLNQQPMLLHRVAPTYPEALLGSGVSGPVAVEFIINSDGTVTSAFAKDPSAAGTGGESGNLVGDFVSKSSPPASADISDSARHELELAALKAINEWVFQPGIRGGRDANTRTEVVLQVNPPVPFIPPSQ